MIHRPEAMLILLFFAATASAENISTETGAKKMLSEGNYSQAIEVLKEQIANRPHDWKLHRLLVMGYLLDENEFWALRALTAMKASGADDCEPNLVIAWIALNMGNAEEALSLLDETTCTAAPEQATRKSILSATALFALGRKKEAAVSVRNARQADTIFPEDRKSLQTLIRSGHKGYIEPFTGKMDWMLGWTSNAQAGSATDPAVLSNAPQSFFSRLETTLRFTAPTGTWVRPGVEGDARFLGYAAEDARGESNVFLGVKPKLLIGNDIPTVEVAYRFDALAVLGGDRYDQTPLWFYNVHRLELELQLPLQLVLFGGGGRRTFRETGRSRMELDGGIGGHVKLLDRWRILGALTVKGYDADNNAYDLRGLTALVSSEVLLPKQWSTRIGILSTLDDYPLSEGFFTPLSPSTKRREVLLKISGSVYTPDSHGLKVGLTYEFANRWSSAPLYEYIDHRVMMKLAYSFSADPFLPKRAKGLSHIEIPYAEAETSTAERVQDLIRQEEAAQRSSSCVE